MIQAISDRFDQNLSRVENLIGIYDGQLRTMRGPKKGAHDTDILRAALVFLHASLEDFLRGILTMKLPESDKGEIDRIPLLGQARRDAEKFGLGSLIQFRDISVGQLINDSIHDHLEKWASFNDVGQIKSSIVKCGLEADGFRYDEINEMVARRHNIVHKADATPSSDDKTFQLKPISVTTLNLYVKKVKELKEFIYDQITPLAYCPTSSFSSYADGVLYLIDKGYVSKEDFYNNISLSRRNITSLIRDMIAIGHASIDVDGLYIRSRVFKIEEADKLIRRFCKNHTVYKEIFRNQNYRNGFSENDFIIETITKCGLKSNDENTLGHLGKNLLRYFWASGYLHTKGDQIVLLTTPATGPYSIASHSLFARKKFNMFFGESPPPTVVSALTGILKENIGRKEAERQFGRNAVYALLKFGLISIDGRPSIPKSMKAASVDEIVKSGALENNVVKFVCEAFEKQPNLSGFKVGDLVAERFGCEWVARSKQRNGAALARWAAWLASYWTDQDTIELRKDVGGIVNRLRSLKKEEFGTLPLVRRYSGKRDALAHGRPSMISDELYDAIWILNHQHNMKIHEISERIGVSRSAIYRASDRSTKKLNIKKDES